MSGSRNRNGKTCCPAVSFTVSSVSCGAVQDINTVQIRYFVSGAFHLRTSVYLLRTLISSFAHDSAIMCALCSHFIKIN